MLMHRISTQLTLLILLLFVMSGRPKLSIMNSQDTAADPQDTSDCCGYNWFIVPSSDVNGIQFIETTSEIEADVLLTNTCAIHENVEQKVWNGLRELRSKDRKYPPSSSGILEASNLESNVVGNDSAKEYRRLMLEEDRMWIANGIVFCKRLTFHLLSSISC